jgi:ABC-2 type transport system permease protein
MRLAVAVVVVAVVLMLRFVVFRRWRERRQAVDEVATATPIARPQRPWSNVLGSVGLVARREILERVRGRIFRVGTLVILLAVGAAIVIPTINSNTPTAQQVGVVGTSSGSLKPLAEQAAKRAGTTVHLVAEPSTAAAEAGVRSGRLDAAVVDGERVVVNAPLESNTPSTATVFVESLALVLGIAHAYEEAALTPTQIDQLANAKPAPVQSLQPSKKGTVKTTSVIGIVLVFLMLTQYNTWILMGVMQEKASRVVEVLLATVRPLQLLGGKVLGIGLVAMGQASLIAVFALVVGSAAGSDLLHGTAPLVLACQLLWLVLGYAFYCWVYAAAGSTAERQDQVQTLALPLSLPILIGYVLAITAASSGTASTLIEVLAYLPPTAPFAMPVLVALNDVTWWQFLLSVFITLAGTAAMAVLAARIYRRAVLRSGGRVHLRELFARRPVAPTTPR